MKKIWKLRQPFMDQQPAIPILGHTQTEVERRFGEACDREDVSGIGTCSYWGLEAECGLQLVIEFREQKQITYLHLEEPELEHSLLHLGWQVKPAIKDAFESHYGKRPRRWRVCRQDDHGNRFVINAFATRREATCLLQTFEQLQHKQTYWIEDTAIQSTK